MACRRCRGLTVVDHFIDMQDDRGHLWLCAWRCVNCGDVVEPGILHNRQVKRSLMGRLVDRWELAQRKPEAIAIGV